MIMFGLRLPIFDALVLFLDTAGQLGREADESCSRQERTSDDSHEMLARL
jgi:hypothetical protein